MAPFAGKVLVTGATGKVGSGIINALCAAGFTCHATSRSPDHISRWKTKYANLPVDWSLVKDQEIPGVYDDAVKGCVAVVHSAGPFNYKHEGDNENIFRNAIGGVENILKAAVSEPTIKRVVVTSSIAAIHRHDPATNGEGWTHDHTHWNLLTIERALGEKKNDPQYGYTLSKKLAEQAAWKFMETQKPNFDLVTLCPATVLGPMPQVVESLEDLDVASLRIWNFIKEAKQTIPVASYPTWTHTLDVAEAHVKALLFPVAGGNRYQLVGGHYTYERVFAYLKKRFPEHADMFPDIPNDGLPLPPQFKTDSSKAEKDLQMRWRSFEETMDSQVEPFWKLLEQAGQK